jgi:hypothetical protein
VRPRSLAIFALVVLALGAFVWFWEREQPGTAEREATAKKVLGGIDRKDVREVRVDRDGVEVRLVRESPSGGGEVEDGNGDGQAGPDTAADEDPPGDSLSLFDTAEWRLVAPLQARADRMAVDGLLTSLLGLEKARTLEGVDRAEYGLAPPQATVTLVSGKRSHTLEVGREIPGTAQRVVALAGGDTVWTVPAAFWGELSRPAGDWRSRQLFPGQRHEVDRLSLQRAGEVVVLARRGDDFWLEAPVTDRADSERVDELLTAVTGLEAVEFLDQGEEPSTGLDAPEAVVEVVRAGRREPFRIALGAVRADGEVTVRAARVDGQLVAVRSLGLDEAAARPPREWRSRAWTSLPVYDVDRVEARDAEGALTLVRAGADWERDGTKIFYGPVSDLLAAVTAARAERLVPVGEGGALLAGQPALTLRLVGRQGNEESLQLWASMPEGTPGRVSGREVMLLLPTELPASLAQHLQAVRDAEPLPEADPGGAGDGEDAWPLDEEGVAP